MSNHHMLTRRKSRSEALSSAPKDSSEAVTNPRKRKRETNSTEEKRGRTHRTSARGKKKIVVQQSETPTVVVSPKDSAISESQNVAIITSESSVVLKENGSSSSGSKRARSSLSNSVLRRSSRARKKSAKILENECHEQHNRNDAMSQNLAANGEECSQFGSGKDAMKLLSKDHHQGDLDNVSLQEERQETQPEAVPQQPVVQATTKNDCQSTCKAIVLFSGNHQNMEIIPVTDNSNITPNPKGRSKLQARRKSSLVQSCRGIKEATLRWKRLAESILKEKLGISVTDSQMSSQNRTRNKARQKSKSEKQKRKRYSSSAKAKEKPGVPRKIDDLLGQMGSWLTDARFPQFLEIETEAEKAFTMNEDDRGDFAKYMVEACEKDPNLRNVLLESVRVLVESGVMHSAASALAQEGPCKEAENVLSAWQDYQKNQNEFPLGVLNAVNQLHEQTNLSNTLSILSCSDRLTFDQTEQSF